MRAHPQSRPLLNSKIQIYNELILSYLHRSTVAERSKALGTNNGMTIGRGFNSGGLHFCVIAFLFQKN